MSARMKKMMGGLLCLVMLLGVLPTSLIAAEHTHQYDNSYTYIDGTKQHYGVCACGEISTTAASCVYPEGVPGWNQLPNETKEGKRTWKCTLCQGKWEETVPAHKCQAGDLWLEDEDPQYHYTSCVYPGCGAWMGEKHEEYMTGYYHKDATTINNDCTRCGRSTSYTITASLTTVEAKAATCSAAGNIKFYICDHCGKYFADVNCQTEITPAEAFINPIAHNYVDGVCTVCGNKVTNVRFAEAVDPNYSTDQRYLFVMIGKGADGKLYAMGEATGDGRRYGVEIPASQVDENGVVTLSPEQAEFMQYEYYFENGSGASTTSTFTVDGGYMTIKNGKIYTFPKSHLDDPNNPRPFDFRQGAYGDDSGLGYAYSDMYDSSTWEHTFEYMTFNPNTLYFEACETEQNTLYIYCSVCEHEAQDVAHTSYIAPTCTEQGTREYWFCTKCMTYYSDAACTQEYEFPDNVDPNHSMDVANYFLLRAYGHKFAANGVCENCAMKRNVYTQVSTLDQFDQLSENAYYIVVFKDGEKAYATRLPGENLYWQDVDFNGEFDLFEIDDNGNGIPDCIETIDRDENSILDYLEDQDFDDEITVNDYHRIYDDLAYEKDIEVFAGSNIVEVTVAADGSITLIDEGAMEIQMLKAGVWGGQEPEGENVEYDKEEQGIQDSERLRAAWVPNYWVANSGMLGSYEEGYLMIQERIYGDRAYPGIIDNKNWKISFNADGTALLVSTWADFDDTAALQLVKYTDEEGNERMTMVGLYGDQWQYSDIMNNATAKLPAYLYASEPVYEMPPHECVWGSWEDDDVTETHTRWCTDPDCNEKQTEVHKWDNGVQSGTATCTEGVITTYTCGDCDATKTETGAALGHDWGEWIDDSVDSHIRKCKRNCGAEEYGGHEWDNWKVYNDHVHKMTCSICQGNREEAHDWDQGVQTKAPTCTEMGVMKYTCEGCGHTKTKEIPVLNHTWSAWVSNDDGTHTRKCSCGEAETKAHIWSGWMMQNDGSQKRECTDCGVVEVIALPADQLVNMTPVDSVANTNLINTNFELIDTVLTDAEQSQVAKGEQVKVYLKVEDIYNTVSATHVAEVEAKAGDAEIGMYLDIDLFKQVGNGNEVQVTETDGKLTITIIVPDSLINTDASVTRTYKIIRVHEDAYGTLITDVIEGEFNPEDKSFTFQTDKFSTYVLVYTNTSVSNTPSTPGTSNTPATPNTPESGENKEPANTDNPKAGDNNNIALWTSLFCISAVALVVLTICNKKRKNTAKY